MNVLAIPLYHFGDDKKYSDYQKMLALSAASYTKNLAGDWKLEVLSGAFLEGNFDQRFSDMHRDIFLKLYQSWQSGKNVLFVDCDTVCIRPTEIFGRFELMVMPWLTAGDSKVHPQYMNGGVIYFPASMKQETWDIGIEKMPKIGKWDDSQGVYNDMYWSQPEHIQDQSLNFSPHVGGPLHISDAKILHYHSSKSTDWALEAMANWEVA